MTENAKNGVEHRGASTAATLRERLEKRRAHYEQLPKLKCPECGRMFQPKAANNRGVCCYQPKCRKAANLKQVEAYRRKSTRRLTDPALEAEYPFGIEVGLEILSAKLEHPQWRGGRNRTGTSD